MKKGIQKHCGHKYRLFLCLVTRYKKFFDQREIKKMSLSVQHPGKDDIIIIIQKHTTPVNDIYHGLPYYLARIQRRKRHVKLRWFDQHFPDREVIVKSK